MDISRQFDSVQPEAIYKPPYSPDPNCSPKSRTLARCRNLIWFVQLGISAPEGSTERLNFTAFYDALLEAKGVSFGDGGGSGVGKAGRKLIFTTGA